MDFLVLLGNEVILRPLVNGLLLLYIVLFSNFGLAIIALTIIIRLITFPLMRRQLRQTQKMQSMQSRVKALQEQFKNVVIIQRRQNLSISVHINCFVKLNNNKNGSQKFKKTIQVRINITN